MKLVNCIIGTLFLLFTFQSFSVAQELLTLEGAIVVQNSEVSSPVPGTIRYNPDNKDFEGFNGQWVSLTLGQGFFGDDVITDVDGNRYRTVVIGTQTWMRENLRTTRYSNGDPIMEAPIDNIWDSLDIGGWCWYENNYETEVPYGKLYNWYAVEDARGICPENWHIPTIDELDTILNYLEPPQGTAMKLPGIFDDGTGYWTADDGGATNNSGFSAIPAGIRLDGDFTSQGQALFVWTATEENPDNAEAFILVNTISAVNPQTYSKNSGLSIRCVKD